MGVSRREFSGLILAAVAGRAGAQPAPTEAPPTPPAPWIVPDDAAIRQILVERIDVQQQGVGIVVGLVDARSRRIVAYGRRAKDDPTPLDGDTVFEIGSMTKVFTALLLSEMAARGEVSPDDPVAKYLPAAVRAPQIGGKQITLIDLATHTSGLPSLPPNFAPKDGANPYADYTPEQLWQFLNSYALTREIGSQYAYSNLGFGLLGQALTRRAGQDYETLMRTRIAAPLGMKDTIVALTPALRARLAPGHDTSREPTANWDLPTLAGAGALRSTANDMLTFLAAELGYGANPLAVPMEAQLAVRRPANRVMDIALGWHVMRTTRGELVWHNGGTGGYRSFMGFDPKARVGVVVLTNMANQVGGDDIGFHLLGGRPLAKLEPPPSARRSVVVPAEQLAGLVGRYVFAPGAEIVVTQDGQRLFAQLTGQPAFEIFAATPNRFFWRVVDATAVFERGPDGRAAALTLQQLGLSQRATRAD